MLSRLAPVQILLIGLVLFALSALASSTNLADDTTLGKQQLSKNDFRGAVVTFARVLQRSPGDAVAHYYTGMAYAGMGEPEVAIEHWQLSLVYDPDSPVARDAREQLNRAITLALAKKAAPPADTSRPPSPQPSNPRFNIMGAQVLDKTTKLIWSRCSYGQVWDNTAGCVGTIKSLSFTGARRAESDGWRLPSRMELVSLWERDPKTKKIIAGADPTVFSTTDPLTTLYWSSSEEDASFSWAVNLGANPYEAILYRTSLYAVRLVRK